jgi:AraC family transcriptional regulator of adaptative response / DNA-3-methyladenine glycosylase II
LRLIDEGALSEGSLETLSARLGVTSRWLRELFERHVGAAPLDVARTRKAHLARRLLEDTALPVEDVAAATGYGSARRLRAAMQQSFRRAPAALRRHRATPSVRLLHRRRRSCTRLPAGFVRMVSLPVLESRVLCRIKYSRSEVPYTP